MAYYLMGLFEINMRLLYGEGGEERSSGYRKRFLNSLSIEPFLSGKNPRLLKLCFIGC